MASQSAAKAHRTGPQDPVVPNPFAFNPNAVNESKQQNTVDYLSPQKRKRMKEYLSNSSINLANGQEKRYSSSDHFQSSNQVQLKNPGMAQTGNQHQERKANIQHQRQPHIWMGRDNEFRNYRRPERTNIDIQELKSSKNQYADAASKLRKHNFQFGFEANEPNSEQQHRSAAMKKSLYEYTKESNDSNYEWRKQQIVRNRASSIQWGLKREDAAPHERSAGKSMHQLSQTQSKLQSYDTGAQDRDNKTIESSRIANLAATEYRPLNTTKQNQAGLMPMHIEVNEDIKAQSMRYLNNRGGKKIDMQHSQKQSVVGSHMVQENARDPQNLEKGTADRNLFLQRVGSVQGQLTNSHIQLGQSQHSRAQSNMRQNSAQKTIHISNGSGINKSYEAGRFKTAMSNTQKSPYLQSQSTSEFQPAAGSANLMSPQEAQQDSLGANKRIRADMIKNNIRFQGVQESMRYPSYMQPVKVDNLVAAYHNRNKDSSQVMGIKIGTTEQHHQGVYKASMNKGTSQVDWGLVNDNRAKIAQYKERMLEQKQQLGHMGSHNDASVKAKAYVPYGRDTFERDYIGQNANAKTNKAQDLRVQVPLAEKQQPRHQAPVKAQGETEQRSTFKQFTSSGKDDATDMINQLKSSSVALGYIKGQATSNRMQGPGARGNDSTIGQIGETKKQFQDVQRRGFESNVIPKDSKNTEMKQGSINKQTFTWNNIKVL